MKVAVFSLFLVIPLLACRALVLAKAKLEECANEGDKPMQCTSKGIIVTLALHNEQNKTETLEAEVNAVYDPAKKEIVQVAKPFRVVLEKSEVVIHYPLFGMGKMVNNKPYEEQIETKKCKSHWKHKKATCGFMTYPKTKTRMLYSQGYCCSCGGVSSERHGHHQRNKALNKCNWWKKKRSAHCLRRDQLWYRMYELTAPSLHFKIVAEIKTRGRAVRYGNVVMPTWIDSETLTLSPSVPALASKDGKARIKWVGDLDIPSKLHDLSQKYLLIPEENSFGEKPHTEGKYDSRHHKDDIIKAGPKEWLFIDKHHFDISGTTCNKIGVSYEAFKFQDNKCSQKKNSCFRNQPYHFWNEDKLRQLKGLSTKYFPASFGPFLADKASADTLMIKYHLDRTHYSMVNLWLDAHDVVLVYKWAPGKIVEAYVEDFEAQSKEGKLTARVTNIGRVANDFTLSVGECTRAIDTVQAKTLNIGPGQTGAKHFPIFAHDSKGTQNSCKVTLRDKKTGELFDTKTVAFKTTATCFDFGACGNVCNVNSSLSCVQPPPKTNKSSGNEFLDLLRRYQVYIYVVVGVVALLVGVKIAVVIKQQRAAKGATKKTLKLTEIVDELGSIIRYENVKQGKKVRQFFLILFAIVFCPFLPCAWLLRRTVRQRNAEVKRARERLQRARKRAERQLQIDFTVEENVSSDEEEIQTI